MANFKVMALPQNNPDGDGSKEILQNVDFDGIKKGQPESWLFFTYGNSSKINVAGDKYKGHNVVCIESDHLQGKGYISQERKDLQIKAKTTFKLSGYYRTEDLGIDKDGKFYVTAIYNNNDKDKKLVKHQLKMLNPSKEWGYFEYARDIEPPVNSVFFMAMLNNCSGKLYFSQLSCVAQKSETSASSKQVYIWREAEGLCPGFTCSNWKPKEYKDDVDFFSGEGAISSIKKEPFVWNFKEKSEVDQETLLPRKNTYKIWLRLYGYRQMPQMDIALDDKKVSSFKTRKTEKTDDKGEYVGGGEFYWQDAGEFTSEGGNHKLKISSEGPFCIDAIMVTTDMSYQPRLFEAREKADRDFFTDIKSAPTIKSEYKVCGVSDKIASPLTFRSHIPGDSPVKINNNDSPAVFHIDLPSCIDIKHVSSHWAGITWNSPERWGKKFLSYKKKGEKVIDNKKYNSYEINLYCLSGDIFVFVQGNSDGFEFNKDQKCFFHLEYKGTKGDVEELDIKTVELKQVKGFSKIFVGPAGKSFLNFFSEYPDIQKVMAYSGINFVNPWIVTKKDNVKWKKFVKDCTDNKIIVTAEFSPFYGKYGPTQDGDFSVDINGRKTKAPTLCPDYQGEMFRNNIVAIEELGRDMGVGIVLDDENYNQFCDKIDYGRKCKDLFAQYLAKKNVPYKDPAVIVGNKKQEKELYDLWVDFKCEMMLDRYRLFRQKYDDCQNQNGSASATDRKFFIPQILKNKSMQESRENSYWDYKKLAEFSTHISPMIYTYQGIRDSHEVGDTIRMYNDGIGKKIIVPTLLAGHRGFGEIPVAEKKMLKYQVFESLMSQSPGIIYWDSSAFFDPLNLVQISEAIGLAQPYEDFFLNGEPCNTIKTSPAWVRIIALKHKNAILIYAANYRNDPDKKVMITLNQKPLKIIEAGRNKEMKINNSSFETDFSDGRGKLFLATF